MSKFGLKLRAVVNALRSNTAIQYIFDSRIFSLSCMLIVRGYCLCARLPPFLLPRVAEGPHKCRGQPFVFLSTLPRALQRNPRVAHLHGITL